MATMPIHGKRLTSFLGILFVAGLIALPSLQADPADLPNSFNLLNQPRLAGDCMGCRPAAETNGVVLSLQSVSDLLGNTTGGAATGTTYSGLLNLGFAVDLQKAIGWEGASFKSTWLWLYGNNLSGNTINNALTVSSIAGNPTLRCYELWFQQNLFQNAVSFRAGMIALDSEFGLSDTAALFVNGTFGIVGFVTQDLPNGGATYPLGAPGVRLALQPYPWLTLRTAFAQGNPFPEQVNTHGFDWNFGPSGGLISFNEMAATWNENAQAQGLLGLPGTVKVGFWIQKGEAPQGPSAGVFSFNAPIAVAYSSGFYGIIDQQLYVVPHKIVSPANGQEIQPIDASSSAKGLSSFVRVGFSPQGTSPVALYADSGLVYTGLIPGRNADKCGIAFGFSKMSEGMVANGLAQGFPNPSFETVAELSYAAQLTPAISMQPDLQYILHPGGTQQYGNALVVGVRAVVNF